MNSSSSGWRTQLCMKLQLWALKVCSVLESCSGMNTPVWTHLNDLSMFKETEHQFCYKLLFSDFITYVFNNQTSPPLAAKTWSRMKSPGFLLKLIFRLRLVPFGPPSSTFSDVVVAPPTSWRHHDLVMSSAASSCKASVRWRNAGGQTAYDVAVNSGCNNMASLLAAQTGLDLLGKPKLNLDVFWLHWFYTNMKERRVGEADWIMKAVDVLSS